MGRDEVYNSIYIDRYWYIEGVPKMSDRYWYIEGVHKMSCSATSQPYEQIQVSNYN